MHINQFDAEDCDDFKHFPKGFLTKVELTKQQQELLVLGDELKKNLSDPNSPFQNFLKYSPEGGTKKEKKIIVLNCFGLPVLLLL